jgi:hypothetical protein
MLRAVSQASELAPATSLSSERFAASVPPEIADPPTDIDVGTIVRVHADDVELALVAIVVDLCDDEADVLPLSVEVDYAAGYDVLLDQAVLGYRSMVQAWNGGTIEVDQVVDHLAVVDDATLDAIDDVYDAALLGDDSPPDANVGSIVVADEDIRRDFQLHSREFAEHFYQRRADEPDTADLLASFGQLLEAKTRERGITLWTLDEELHASSPKGLPSPLTTALDGTTQWYDALAPDAFGDKLADLGLDASEGLKQILLGCKPVAQTPGRSTQQAVHAATAPRRAFFRRARPAHQTWVEAVLGAMRRRSDQQSESPDGASRDGKSS